MKAKKNSYEGDGVRLYLGISAEPAVEIMAV